jgi:hypothetical protein
VYTINFKNDVPYPVRVWYVVLRNDPATLTRVRVAKDGGVVQPEGSAQLTGICVAQTLELLLLPADTTTVVPTTGTVEVKGPKDPIPKRVTWYQAWTGVPNIVIPDGMYVALGPPTASVFDPVTVSAPPYDYTITMDPKTPKPTPDNRNQSREEGVNMSFSRVARCGAWYEDCPMVMGVRPDACTGFLKFKDECEAWCAQAGTVACDAAKLDACNKPLEDNTAQAAFAVQSPECACMLQSASTARAPVTLDLTFKEFYDLLQGANGLPTHLHHPECLFPMCADPDKNALLTSQMANIRDTQCPTSIQVCIALAQDVRFDEHTRASDLTFRNECMQQIFTSNGLKAPNPLYPPEPEGGGGSAPARPTPTPNPTPTPGPPTPTPVPPARGPTASDTPWWKTTGFYVGMAILGVLVVIAIVLGVLGSQGKL